jgi:hypothetical protein
MTACSLIADVSKEPFPPSSDKKNVGRLHRNGGTLLSYYSSITQNALIQIFTVDTN